MAYMALYQIFIILNINWFNCDTLFNDANRSGSAATVSEESSKSNYCIILLLILYFNLRLLRGIYITRWLHPVLGSFATYATLVKWVNSKARAFCELSVTACTIWWAPDLFIILVLRYFLMLYDFPRS